MKQKTQLMSAKKKNAPQKRWVLLERVPTILTPRILLLFFLYSVAFTLFLIGLKLFFLEQKAAWQNHSEKETSTEISSTQSVLYLKESNTQIQKNIAKNIIRLHVIANSDSDTDQQLKLAVRNEIIGSLQTSLRNADSIAQAKEIITARQTEICASAKRVLASHNCNAPVKVSLESRYFPVKQYGDLVFPAGTYQALCVEIGKAEGRNWWCVLFPSLCFVNETTATVPDDSKDKLKKRLSSEEYNTLIKDSEIASNSNPLPDTDSQPSSNAAPQSTPDISDSSSKPELHFGIIDWFTK